MNILTLEGIRKAYGDKELYDSITFGLDEHDKTGLIGINGTGKSTLLRIAAGQEEPDEGKVSRANNLKTAVLPQTPVFDDNKGLMECVMDGIGDMSQGWNMDVTARQMLTKLGFSDFSRKAGALSGGEKKKLALIRTLMIPSDLLILDEPTNHLDLSMIRWLENELKRYKGAVLLITHDRYFLDDVCTRILELDNTHLYSYESNYSGFLLAKDRRIRQEMQAEEKRQSWLRNELEWVQRGAKARTTKQKARLARYEEVESQTPLDTRPEESVQMESLGTRMGKKTIEVSGVSKSFKDRVLIRDFTYNALHNDRVGIVGPNGCGKSTLLKMIMGQVLPDAGTITVGETLRVGYLAQNMDEFDREPAGKRAIDFVKDTAEYIRTPSGTISASKMMERFLFDGSSQYTPLEKLSGGEKRRLMLLKVLMGAPNVLLLDEPTNDLDMATMTVFEDFLSHFEGIVIAVSHDRYFLDAVAGRILAFEEDGHIRRYDGNYSDFAQKTGRDGDEQVTGPSQTASSGSRTGRAGSKSEPDPEETVKKGSWNRHQKRIRFTYAEQREYDTIEDDIAAMEDRLSEIDKESAEAATDFIRLTGLAKEREDLQKQLDLKMQRWEYLSEKAEQIEALEKNDRTL